MPLQSGSDAVLRAMRRSYRREKYLGILERVRAAIPDAAITTDIIVGFPGETERDFAGTLDTVRQARFAGAFTFQYSTRPGTPAATMDGQVPAAVVAERYERLAALVAEIAGRKTRRFAGREVEVLVAEGEGRKDVHHAPAARAGQGQQAGPLRPGGHRAAPRRRGDHRGDPGRPALPHRGRRAAGGAADPGRGRLAGAAGRRRRRG